MKPRYEKNTPLLFKKKASEFVTQHNALLSRDIGVIPSGEVCEIIIGWQPWIVKYSDITSIYEWNHEASLRWQVKIEEAIKLCGEKLVKSHVAARLGISPSTLRKYAEEIRINLGVDVFPKQNSESNQP